MATDTCVDKVVELHFQYAKQGRIMTDDTYGEQDADEASACTRDGYAFVCCERTPRGRWRINHTDGAAPIPPSAYRYRFSTLADAADYVAKKSGLTVRRVDSWF